jgi:hypothetical protein
LLRKAKISDFDDTVMHEYVISFKISMHDRVRMHFLNIMRRYWDSIEDVFEDLEGLLLSDSPLFVDELLQRSALAVLHYDYFQFLAFEDFVTFDDIWTLADSHENVLAVRHFQYLFKCISFVLC